MDKYILMDTIKKLFVRGKGVLAMDESHKTLKKRFDEINLEYSLKNRLEYRDLLCCKPNFLQ
jgi:fructose-bisphosphate aldolase, class I